MEFNSLEELAAFVMEMAGRLENLEAAQPPVEDNAEQPVEEVPGDEVPAEEEPPVEEPPVDEPAVDEEEIDLEEDELAKLLT